MRVFRIFDLLDRLRLRSAPVSAETLAEEMGVSLRTIYRDLADLQALGAPIRGEGGIGYVMEKGYFMPSLHLQPQELEALAFGARLVAARGDTALAEAAGSALAKITSAVGADDRTTLLQAPLEAGPSSLAAVPHLNPLRIAIRDRCLLHLRYRDLSDRRSERIARPLGLTAFDAVWLLTIWCERAQGFRHLRVDRIEVLEKTGGRFQHERGKRFADCLIAEGGAAIGYRRRAAGS